MRVLALDPGERVGWARADVDESGGWKELRHGITPLKDMALAIHGALIQVRRNGPLPYISENDALPLPWERKYDVVVCEDWRLRPGKERLFIGSSFPAVQFIGMVRLCCWLSNTKLVMQGADTKSTADKTLKALWPEMYETVTQSGSHDDQHDLDAIRHLWFFTYRNTDGIPKPQEAA